MDWSRLDAPLIDTVPIGVGRLADKVKKQHVGK